MVKVRSVAENYIDWIVGEGSINFWFDSWLEGKKISDMAHPPMGSEKLTVKQVICNDRGAFDRCKSVVSAAVMGKVSNWSANLNTEKDYCISSATVNGQFSLKSAWSICRHRQNQLFFHKLKWNSYIPLKWSLIVWRAVIDRLPLDGALQKIGVQLASKCNCCLEPKR